MLVLPFDSLEPMKAHPPIWTAVYTRARSERVVASQLRSSGFESYVPVRREVRRWSDRKKLVETPLLPSYVLVRLDPLQSHRLYQAHGVVRIVTFCGRLAVVQPSEIDLLKRLEQVNQAVRVSTGLFRFNESVQITSGAFEGLRGKVVRSNGTCRVALQIEQLGCAVMIEVPCSSVRPLTEDVTKAA